MATRAVISTEMQALIDKALPNIEKYDAAIQKLLMELNRLDQRSKKPVQPIVPPSTPQALQQTAKSAGNANFALTQMAFAVQDMPYFMTNMRMGIMAVSNNIGVLIANLGHLRQSGSVLKQLSAAMAGPAGLVFAGSAVLAVLQALSMTMGQGDEATSAWADSMERLKGELKTLREPGQFKVALEAYESAIAATEEKIKGLEKKTDAFSKGPRAAGLSAQGVPGARQQITFSSPEKKKEFEDAGKELESQKDALEILKEGKDTIEGQAKASEALRTAEALRLATLKSQRGEIATLREDIDDQKEALEGINLTREQYRQIADDIERKEARLKEMTMSSSDIRKRDLEEIDQKSKIGLATMQDYRKVLEGQLATLEGQEGTLLEQIKLRLKLKDLAAEELEFMAIQRELGKASLQDQLDVIDKQLQNPDLSPKDKGELQLKRRGLLDDEAERVADIARMRAATITDEQERMERLHQIERDLIIATIHDQEQQTAALAELDVQHQRNLASLEEKRMNDLVSSARRLESILMQAFRKGGDEGLQKMLAMLQIAIQIAKMLKAAELAEKTGKTLGAADILDLAGSIVVAIASGGFQSGGYTGSGRASEVAGPAHYGEVYFEKPVVDRGTNKQDLLAIRREMQQGFSLNDIMRQRAEILSMARPNVINRMDLGPVITELRNVQTAIREIEVDQQLVFENQQQMGDVLRKAIPNFMDYLRRKST